MKKRLFSLFLTLVLVFSLMPGMGLTVAAADVVNQSWGNIVWSFEESSGTLTVNGSGAVGASDSAVGVYPWNSLRGSVKSLIIGDDITYIGARAFRDMPQMTSVQLGSSVGTIGLFSFSSCTALQSVAIPASVTQIGDLVTNSSYGGNPFNDCTALTSFTVDEANEVYKAVDGVIFSKDGSNLFIFPAGKTGSYTIPATVTAIGNTAFRGAVISEITFLTQVSFGLNWNIDCDAFIAISSTESVLKGSGSKYDPYLIDSKEDLVKFSELINTKNDPKIAFEYQMNDLYYRQTVDIVFNEGYSYEFQKDSGLVAVSYDGTVVFFIGTGYPGESYFADTASTISAIYTFSDLTYVPLTKLESGTPMTENSYILTEKELAVRVDGNDYILENWDPIGGQNINGDLSCFNGYYNGNLRSISGLLCLGTDEVSNYGLFGGAFYYCNSNISNIQLNNSAIIAQTNSDVAGILGRSWGYNSYGNNVNNCIVNDCIIAAVNSHSVGSILGGPDYNRSGIFQQCQSDATIIGVNVTELGGIVGSTYGDVYNCIFSGNIFGYNCSRIGGIVTIASSGWITNCVNYGNVESVSPSKVTSVDGIAMTYGQVDNCICAGNIKGDGNDSVAGIAEGNNATNCIFAGTVSSTGSTNVSAIGGGSTSTNNYYLKNSAYYINDQQETVYCKGKGQNEDDAAKYAEFETGGVSSVLASLNASLEHNSAHNPYVYDEFVYDDGSFKNKYTVSFDSNGGTIVSPQNVYTGESVSMPENPTKDDSEFVKWQYDGSDYDFSMPVCQNTTLTAVWKVLPKVSEDTTITVSERSTIHLSGDMNASIVKLDAVAKQLERYTAQTVDLDLSVTESDKTSVAATAILAEIGTNAGIETCFADVVLTGTIGSTQSSIEKSVLPIEVLLPISTENMSDIAVYRYSGTLVEELEEADEAHRGYDGCGFDRTFYIDNDGIHIFMKEYTTYCVTYQEQSATSHSSGSGTSTDNNAVSLTADAKIGINFYLDVEAYLDDLTNAKVELTYNHNRTTYDTNLSTDTIAVSADQKQGSGQVMEGSYLYTAYVAPDQMKDDVTIKLKDGSGSVVYTNTYTVADYCQAVSEHEEDAAFTPELKNLCNAMLNYGAETQKYFGYNKTNLANGGTTLATGVNDAVAADMTAAGNKFAFGSNAANTTYSSASIVLYEGVEIRLYFDASSDVSVLNAATFKSGGADIEEAHGVGFDSSRGKSYLYIKGIAPDNFDKQFIINYGGADRFNVSVLGFAKLQIAGGNDTANLMQAMYKYNKAAEAYFAD